MYISAFPIPPSPKYFRRSIALHHNHSELYSNMSTGLLFVTAPEADYKAINEILLHLRDWEYGGGADRFRLVTTKNAYDLDGPATPLRPRTQAADETSPRLSSDLDNTWAGAALEDVEAFCLDLARDTSEQSNRYNSSLYVVVDSTDLQARSCILGERAVDEEAEEFTWLDSFNKMRIPWDKLYLTWCNLDIANMNFEEFTQEEEDGGEGVDGWFTFKDISDGDDLSEDNRRKRDREIQRFRDKGHI